MSKKYLPALLTLASIIACVFFWDKVVLEYNFTGQAYAEYSINNYNANNDTIRYILFVSLPLIVFLLSHLHFNASNVISIKKVLFDNKNILYKKNTSNYLNHISLIFVLLLITEFLTLNFNIFLNYMDHFHEGSFLTPANNFYLTNKAWSSSYIEFGFFGNFFPVFLWKIFTVQTIGSTKLFTLILLLLNKILLVFLSKEISKNSLFPEKLKILYFVILTILSLSLVSYTELNVSEFPTRSFLFLLFFLIFFKTLYKINLFSFNFFVLGIFSIFSLVWYLDIGAYINALLFFILLYFFARFEFKKCLSILLGILVGWLLFIYTVPTIELKEFFNNSISIFLTADYVNGLIYPTPFLSGDFRSTRALLLIIIAGVLVIISNLNKGIKMNYYNKAFFIFLFIASILVFKTGMMRSDTPHIKAASGFHLFVIYSIGLNFLFDFFLIKKNNNLIILKLNLIKISYFKALLSLFVIITLLIFKFNIVNIKNLPTSISSIKNLIYQKDEDYLSSDYKKLINYYKNLAKQDNCIQILTNELSIPYFLKKPTCTKFYLMWFVSPVAVQEKFVNQLKKTKPRLILYNSEISPYHFSEKHAPILYDYIKRNYSINSKYKSWTFYVIK